MNLIPILAISYAFIFVSCIQTRDSNLKDTPGGAVGGAVDQPLIPIGGGDGFDDAIPKLEDIDRDVLLPLKSDHLLVKYFKNHPDHIQELQSLQQDIAESPGFFEENHEKLIMSLDFSNLWITVYENKNFMRQEYCEAVVQQAYMEPVLFHFEQDILKLDISYSSGCWLDAKGNPHLKVYVDSKEDIPQLRKGLMNIDGLVKALGGPYFLFEVMDLDLGF